MTKTYKCRLDFLGILVPYKGSYVHVNFERAVLSATGIRGCKYTTDDVELQKAIEAHKDFGTERKDGIWTDDIEPVVEQTEEPVAEVKKTRKTKAKAE